MKATRFFLSMTHSTFFRVINKGLCIFFPIENMFNMFCILDHETCFLFLFFFLNMWNFKDFNLYFFFILVLFLRQFIKICSQYLTCNLNYISYFKFWIVYWFAIHLRKSTCTFVLLSAMQGILSEKHTWRIRLIYGGYIYLLYVPVSLTGESDCYQTQGVCR